MDYKKIYWDLIRKAVARKAKNIPLEGERGKNWDIHHIIPTSHNGPDVDWNKIPLTFKEHIMTHKLYYKAYNIGCKSNKSVKKILSNKMKSIEKRKLNHDMFVNAKNTMRINSVEYEKISKPIREILSNTKMRPKSMNKHIWTYLITNKTEIINFLNKV